MNSLRLRVFAWWSCAALLLALRAYSTEEPGLSAARALVKRVLPEHAAQIDVELLKPAPGGFDAFEVETRNGRLVLRGANGVGIGPALNWYLRNIAHAQLSWNGDNLSLPKTLAPVERKVRVSSPYRHRVYLNYCTFNYTASWWDRARWEREIDWMALSGITTPLAVVGQEAVWQATLRRFGMNDDEIRRFLVGPAFFAWQWMTNIEGWGGPLPQSWIDSHLELGRFIVQRERALGMTPILQGFTGCVPLDFLTRFPQARIRPKAIWCAVPPGTAQLDPEDPLFEQVGRAFLEEQARLLGVSHLYAADPFHEGEPPKSTPEYLHDVGATLYRLTHDFDPQATIVMQGWSIREGIVKGIPADRLLVLDLTGRKWRETETFWGRPWVAGVLHNYGGRNSLGGALPKLATNAPSLLGTKPGGRIEGIGMFPEGIEHNPILYQLAADLAWEHTAPELPAWVRSYVNARYGRDVPSAHAAWARLLSGVYAQHAEEAGAETPLLARPALDCRRMSAWGDFTRGYDPMSVWTAWAELLDAAGEVGAVEPYRYDLVDVARQALVDLSVPLQREVSAAYLAGDPARFAAAKLRFLGVGQDLDRLLATRPEFLLGRWIAGARQWGTNREEADLYERNARQLITVWGPENNEAYLFDYAGREWSGLIDRFYLERWRKFFAYLEHQPADYRDADLKRAYERPANDANDFYRYLSHWEYGWCDGHEPHPAAPVGDAVEIARELREKWVSLMQDFNARFDWTKAELRP